MKIETAKLAKMEVHDILGAVISPMPIAFISTVGQNGVFNAAPFAFVTMLSLKPPIICFSMGLQRGRRKDTSRNIDFTGDFVVNTVDEPILQQAVQAAAEYPSDVSEIKEVGLTAIPSERVKSPRVAESPISVECKVVQRITLGEGENLRDIVLGEALLIHLRDNLWVDGKIDSRRLKLMGRLASGLYCRTGDIVEANYRKV